MCGIAGIFAYSPDSAPVERSELVRIRERMAARGPDSAGEWFSADGIVGLAHRRLAIIDLDARAAQPMLDPETGNVIVFNGEIYNYRELRRELETRGLDFRTNSDTEVLLKLYAVHGADMLSRLRGMFAFGLWDAQRQGLLLARDPFGIKPLYYADDGRSVRFASQVKALLTGGGIDTTPDPAGHVGFLLWGHVPEPFTLYRAIQALPAGSALWIGRDGARRIHVFFDLSGELRDSTSLPDPVPKSAAEAHERLRDTLRDSVRHHLVADVPVGVFLSAGRDSTTVAALASEVASGPLRALTLGFREYADTPLDETPLATEVARRYGLAHEVRWITKDEFASALEPLLEAMDQPSIDGVNTYFVARAAREAGWKVALSGLGGDEFFAGYQSFHEIPRAVRALRPLAAFPRLGRIARVAVSPLIRRMGLSPKWAGLLEYGGDWAGGYLLRRALSMPWELRDRWDPRFVEEGLERLDTLASLRRTIEGLASDRLRVMALEAAWYMRNQLLRDTDWASMAHGLEVRVPLVDVELFRTVAQLCRAGFPLDKRELGRTPRPSLAESILARAKTGFSVPVREWLLATRTGGGSDSLPKRGLRGWAEVVYAPAQVDDPRPKTAKPGRQLGQAERQPPSRQHESCTQHIIPISNVRASSTSLVPEAVYSCSFLPRAYLFLVDILLRSSNLLLRISRRLLWPRRLRKAPKKICVYRIGNIGDTVCAIPAILAIRREWPAADLTLLSSPGDPKLPGLRDVLAREDWYKEVISYLPEEIRRPRGLLRLIRRLRVERFDVWIELPVVGASLRVLLRNMLLARFAGAKWGAGWRLARVGLWPAVQSSMRKHANEVQRLLDIVRAEGIRVRDAEWKVWTQREDCVAAERLLAEALSTGRPLVAIAPGSKRATNRWITERWAEVVRYLDTLGFHPVLLGGSADARLCAEIVCRSGRCVTNLAGHTSIPQVGHVLRRCMVAICVDSGIQHIAVAVGTSCITLMAARDYRGSWYPDGRHVVLERRVPCHTCQLEECPRDNLCMREISVNDVVSAFARVYRSIENREEQLLPTPNS